MRNKNLRKSHVSDPHVQGRLILHIVGYWLLLMFTAGAFFYFVELLIIDPRDAWQNMLRRHVPTALAAVCLGPIYLRDMYKLTNRLTGPVMRLRRSMHELAETGETAPIKFRKGDFWLELADDFNRVAQRVRAANQPTEPADAETERDVAPGGESADLAPHELASC